MDDLNLNVLKNIVRTGWVSSVNVEERTARVIFEDKGETIVSGELKVLKNPPWIPEYYAPYRTEYEAGGSGYPQFESHKHDLIVKPWLPQKGEFVLCLYIPRDDGDGFVIGGFERMAIIGSWGDITFSVSRQTVKTFDGLKWESGVKYSAHDRHLKEPLLEFTGPDTESMSFSMFFSVFLGVNPIAEVSKLLKAMRRGEVHRLVIGPKAYGTNKWVITKLSNALERYDNRGNLLVASVNVTMNSYAAR